MYKLPSELHKANKIFEKISGERHEMRLFCQTMEECSELNVAILHLLRGRNNSEEVMSEIADVIICIDSLIEKYGGYKKLNKVLKEKSKKYLNQMRKAADLSDIEKVALAKDFDKFTDRNFGPDSKDKHSVDVYMMLTDFSRKEWKHDNFYGRIDKVKAYLNSCCPPKKKR